MFHVFMIRVIFTGSYVPGPYLAEYIATKHYMHSFTEVQSFFFRAEKVKTASNIMPMINSLYHLQSLALETEGTGVVIQEMDPGAVNTEMTKVIYHTCKVVDCFLMTAKTMTRSKT